MNDKERFVQIKNDYYECDLDCKDIDWLIQRVHELELEINDWRAEVQKWQKFYEKSEESHLETKELLNSIVNQNKRYRVALENICVSPFQLDIDEAVAIAKQALEGKA